MRRGWIRAIFLAALLGIAVPESAAQAVLQIKLKPPDARIDLEFSAIGSLRELADGRVIVTDTKENRLVVLDLKAGTTKAIGGVGSGPAEFRRVSTLAAIGGDSTLMQDSGNRRWLVLRGDSIVLTLPASTPAAAAVPLLRATDRGDLVQSTGYVRSAPNQPAVSGESTYVLLVRRSTAAIDTVARLMMAWSEMEVLERHPDGSVRRGNLRSRALDGDEAALLLSDGSLAVVRLNPYRVDWRSPAGVFTKGSTLPVPQEPVDGPVKARYMAQFPRAPNGSAMDVARIRDWAPFVAPIARFCSCLSEAPDGKLLVQRQAVNPREAPRYDVIDRRGALSGFILLAPGERIVGRGVKSLFVSWKDADDIERLRRHPWP